MYNSNLNVIEYRKYLDTEILPTFMNLVDKDFFSVIINRDLQIEAGTDKSARSVGLNNWTKLKGVSFLDFANEGTLEYFFKGAYTASMKPFINEYVQKLLVLQEKVFKDSIVIQFIDMLPYNNQFLSYVTTYVPLIHPDGEVVAIQSFSVESYILRFQGHISSPNEIDAIIGEQFTVREQEVLFLLSNGATQEQISQMLNISRGTVAAMISNQLCPKFGIAGANTKLLTEAAIKNGMYKTMPKSLWRPCLIILNIELMDLFSVST